MPTDEERQRVVDGLAFKRLAEDEELWPAMHRLVSELRHDATAQFASNSNLKRAWLTGVLHACDLFLANMTQTAQDAQTTLEQEKQARELARSGADDGIGSGDFAGL